jgi:hypothetical protein
MGADAPIIATDAVVPTTEPTHGSDLVGKNGLASSDMKKSQDAVLQQKINLGTTGHPLPAMQIVGLSGTDDVGDLSAKYDTQSTIPTAESETSTATRNSECATSKANPGPSTESGKPEPTPESDQTPANPADQPTQAEIQSRRTLQSFLERTVPDYLPTSPEDDPKKVDDQIEQKQQSIEDESKAGIFGPNSREAYQRLLDSWQTQDLPSQLSRLSSYQLPVPANCPFKIPGDDKGLSIDPRFILEQIAQHKLQPDLGLDKDKTPSEADVAKLAATFAWMQECSKRIGDAQTKIADKQTAELLEKKIKAKGWPPSWLEEFKRNPDQARTSAHQMIELAQTTENYCLALSDLQRASGGKFPQVLAPGATKDKNGRLHFDLPQTLEQRDPANQLKIDALHRWLGDEGVKIDQALKQYNVVDANPDKIVFLGDRELPAGYKALLSKSDNRFVGVVPESDIKDGDGCKALLDKSGQLIAVSSTAEAKEKENSLEKGQHYVDCNVADTNLIAARFKVRTEKDAVTGEDKIIVSQSLQPEKGEWWNYQNIGAAKVGKAEVFGGSKDEYKNEKFYKPDDFVPVLTGGGMKLVPAKELEDFRLNQQIFYYGVKAGVAAMDATMVIQCATGVGEAYFAGRLATREALMAITKNAVVAGSGICNSAAGRANPITNAIDSARGLYFMSHIAISGGVGTANWLGGQIEATPRGANVVQNLLRKATGARRIVPSVADNHDPLTALSFSSIFDNSPKLIEFQLQGTEHVVPATITRMDSEFATKTTGEDILEKMNAISSKVASAAMAGLSASMLKGFSDLYEQDQNKIHGDPLVNASKDIGNGQGWQPVLALTMKVDPLTGSDESEISEQSSHGPNQNDSEPNNERSPKIDALNTLELTVGEGQGRRILEETKAKLLDKDTTPEDIEKYKNYLASVLLFDGDTLARSVNFNVAALTEKTVANLNNPDDRTALSPSLQRFLNDKPRVDPDTKFAAEAALVALSDLKDGQLQSQQNGQAAKSIASTDVEVPLRPDLDCPKIKRTESVDTERVILDLRERMAKSTAPLETIKNADALLKIGAISELEYGATLEHVLKDPNCGSKDKIDALLGTSRKPLVQVIMDQREREGVTANDSLTLQGIAQGQSFGADSRALEQTLKEVAAGDKDPDVRATCVAIVSALDSNNDKYIKRVFGAYQTFWQKPPAGAWSDFVTNNFQSMIDLPISPVPTDGDAEHKLLSLYIAKDTRAVQIRAAQAILSLAGESNPQNKQGKQSALDTYANAAGAFDVVDSVKVYDIQNTKLALQELNQGAFKEIAKSDPALAISIVQKTLTMLNSPLNERESAEVATLLDDVTKLTENADSSSSQQQYVAILEKMLGDSAVDCPELREAAIKNLAAVDSTASAEAIRKHCTTLPTITVNGKEESASEPNAKVRQAAIQALVQLKDSSLPATVADGLLELKEPDIAVRSMLRDLRVANQGNNHQLQLQTGPMPDPIFSEKYKDLEAFSKDTKGLSEFLSGEFSKVLAEEPERWAENGSPLRNYASLKEIAAWKKTEQEQWEKLSQLAIGTDAGGAGEQRAIDSRADQARIVLYQLIQGTISPSQQNKQNLVDQDWHVQEKAAQALAQTCQTGIGDRDLSATLIENCLAHPENLSPQVQSELLAAWQKLCAEKSADGQNVIPAERALRVYDSYRVDQQPGSKWSQQAADNLAEKLAMLNGEASGVSLCEPQPSGDRADADTLIESIKSLTKMMRAAVVERYQQKYHRSLSQDIEAKFGRDSEECKRISAIFDAA